MACLVNDFASFDTLEDPGGASIVERKDFQAKRPLCKGPLEVSNESKWVGAISWAKVTDAVTLEQNHQLLSCKLP